MRRILSFLLFPAIAIVLAPCASANTARLSAKTHISARSEAVSEAQINGISSAVVDQLWARTDYYWHRGDYPRIIHLDRIITEVDPHFLQPYATGGWLMESDGDLKDAEAYYALGALRNSGESYAWFQLGAFYFNTMHDYAKATTVFLKSSALPDAGVNDYKMLAHSAEHAGNLQLALKTWQIIKVKFPTAPAVDSNLQRVKALASAAAFQPHARAQ